MANRQLVDYIRAQRMQRASTEQIRTILLQQGWMSQDVEAAILEADQQTRTTTHKEHHMNFLVVTISIIIILGLIFALFITVFKDGQKPTKYLGEKKEDNVKEEVKTLPLEKKEDPKWYVCKELVDYAAKNACYYDINFLDNTYDCDEINVPEEKNACYRGKNQVLLEQYEQEDE